MRREPGRDERPAASRTATKTQLCHGARSPAWRSTQREQSSPNGKGGSRYTHGSVPFPLPSRGRLLTARMVDSPGGPFSGCSMATATLRLSTAQASREDTQIASEAIFSREPAAAGSLPRRLERRCLMGRENGGCAFKWGGGRKVAALSSGSLSVRQPA